MRALSVHPDLIVFVSQFWQTTCTAVRAGDEGFVIDSPIYPEELQALPGILEQAGFPASALLATHGDWDHLLGRIAFPGAALGCGETTARRLQAEPGAAQRELRDFDDEQYVEGRPPLSLGQVQQLPVPGKLSLGPNELELHPADGHTADGTAYSMPWLGVLVCGDYLSPVEIPWISEGGSLNVYQATLERLRPLVREAATVVPGHGRPLSSDEALQILAQDLAYLEALATQGAGAALPRGSHSKTQRKIHAENLNSVRSRPGGGRNQPKFRRS